MLDNFITNEEKSWSGRDVVPQMPVDRRMRIPEKFMLTIRKRNWPINANFPPKMARSALMAYRPRINTGFL